MNFKSIRGTFESFEQLLITMENLQRKQSTLLVGIDGCGGSGKSTFAKEIAKLSPQITIVHMDDFYLPSYLRINGTSEEKPIGADFYDFKIFVDCPKELRLKRGIERDGEEAKDIWEKIWMVAEDKYMMEHKPFEGADLVVDGCGDN